MKHYTWKGMRKKFHFSIIFGAVLSLMLASCVPDSDDLGVNIFPPNDTILIQTDTILNFETRLTPSRNWITSLDRLTANANRTFFLGSKRDTLTGLSKAEIVTQLGLAQIANFGDSALIDSLKLYLYFTDVVGDSGQEMHITVYEFLDSLDMDSSYHSDYDITGKYNPVPLVDEIIVPEAGKQFEFDIENQDYFDRIVAAVKNESDSILIYNSRFQRNFRGFYITSETLAEGSNLAKIQLANNLSALQFKYLPDSLNGVIVDTIPFSSYRMSFNHLYTQKVNIFHQDFTGTALDLMLRDPYFEPHIGYVSGMSGVSVKVSLPDPATYLKFEDLDRVAITAARLKFYVIPEDISGILIDDYPDNLLMDTRLADGTYTSLYDYVISTSDVYFGKLTQSNENSAFVDPLYYYTFNIGRHMQSVLTGEIENSDLIIYMENPVMNSDIIKFWSNYSGQEGGLSLELIYTKF